MTLPLWLTSDEMTAADPFIALILIAVTVAVLRVRRPMRPVGRHTMRRINTTIDGQKGER